MNSNPAIRISPPEFQFYGKLSTRSFYSMHAPQRSDIRHCSPPHVYSSSPVQPQEVLPDTLVALQSEISLTDQ